MIVCGPSLIIAELLDPTCGAGPHWVQTFLLTQGDNYSEYFSLVILRVSPRCAGQWFCMLYKAEIQQLAGAPRKTKPLYKVKIVPLTREKFILEATVTRFYYVLLWIPRKL